MRKLLIATIFKVMLIFQSLEVSQSLKGPAIQVRAIMEAERLKNMGTVGKSFVPNITFGAISAMMNSAAIKLIILRSPSSQLNGFVRSFGRVPEFVQPACFLQFQKYKQGTAKK